MKSYSRRHPDVPITSFYKLEREIREITGVVPMESDMCPNTCIGYTAVYAHLDTCPKCGESRYETDAGGKNNIPRRVFHTIPLGPQIQAIYRTAEGVEAINHRNRRTQEILFGLNRDGGVINAYDDVYTGSAYLKAVTAKKIKSSSTVIMFSMDGAQLYRNKHSDCWIYIWILLDYDPTIRYMKKHVLVGGVFPGPNKPKNIDSFLFPGFHHVAALMHEGLRIWNYITQQINITRPHILLATADGPAMAFMEGSCGHCGAYGCRLYCAVKGRRYPGDSHYYPALLLPDNYTSLDVTILMSMLEIFLLAVPLAISRHLLSS